MMIDHVRFEKFGDIGQYALPIAAGLYTISQGNIQQALQLGFWAGIQKIEVVVLKNAIFRSRPQPYYPGCRSPEDHQSFPSGHTAGAALAVSFVARLYGITQAIPIAALATLVGISRYISKKHWSSDIVFGGLMGLAHGYISAAKR